MWWHDSDYLTFVWMNYTTCLYHLHIHQDTVSYWKFYPNLFEFYSRWMILVLNYACLCLIDHASGHLSNARCFFLSRAFVPKSKQKNRPVQQYNSGTDGALLIWLIHLCFGHQIVCTQNALTYCSLERCSF